MLDKKNINRNDDLGKLIQEVGNEMLPPPELEKAVIADVPLGTNLRAGTHIRKFTGAVLAYAAGLMLLLGAIVLLPKLFDRYSPVVTNPNTTPHQSVSEPTAVMTNKPIIHYPADMGNEHRVYLDTCAEFAEFYRAFSTVNTAPLVIPFGLDSEYLIMRYMFRGDIYFGSENAPKGYAFKSDDKRFELTIFGSLDPIEVTDRDPMRDDVLQDQRDYTVYLQSFVQSAPIESLENLQLKPFEGNGDNPNHFYYDNPSYVWDGEYLTYYTSWEWNPQTMRRYDVVQGDTVLLSFVTRVNLPDADDLHDELCKMVMENLVSFG